MQTLRLRLRDLRAVSSGAWPPADGVPIPALVAPDQERRPALPNPPRPTCAVGLRSAGAAHLTGTDPESGAVPRGHQRQRAIRVRLPLVGGILPDLVCRAGLVRQTAADDLPSLRCGARRADHQLLPACLRVGMAACLPVRVSARAPVDLAACLPVCAVARPRGWPAGRMPGCMSASLHARQSACLCPSPDR